MGGYWNTLLSLATQADRLLAARQTILGQAFELQRLRETAEFAARIPEEELAKNDAESDGLVDKLLDSTKHVSFTISGVVTPERPVTEGTLIKVASLGVANILQEIEDDWSKAFAIPPYKWEEVVANAYSLAGFEEVELTPRSGDHGRDVIAIRKGFGSIKIISSVKAYKPSHLVEYDDVRALLGVLSGERDASKGVVITTSDFPPRILKDPFIAPFLPYRLELMNGVALRSWLKELMKK